MKSWVLPDVIAPFFITRFALLLVGWFSQYFQVGSKYYSNDIAQRGWEFTQARLLDIWGRWDTSWYFGIVRDGYYLRGDVDTVQSNIAFFPLYPFSIKFLSQLFPDSISNDLLMFIGVLLSNIFLVVALIYLYKLVKLLFHSSKIARLTIWYLLLFPTGFFFSAVYTESMYLCFSVIAIYKGYKHKWAQAAVFGSLVALTRSLGGLVLLPIAFEYFRSVDFKITKIKRDVLWLLLIPFTFLMYLGNLYPMTKDFFAPIKVQNAWIRKPSFPWEAVFDPLIVKPFLTQLDRVIALFMVGVSAASFFVLPIELFIYSAILLIMPLTTGSLTSISRYYLVIFPLFMILAKIGNKHKLLDQFFRIVFWTIQIMFFIAWCQFYWLV